MYVSSVHVTNTKINISTAVYTTVPGTREIEYGVLE
jgi:hypothetical protein